MKSHVLQTDRYRIVRQPAIPKYRTILDVWVGDVWLIRSMLVMPTKTRNSFVNALLIAKRAIKEYEQ